MIDKRPAMITETTVSPLSATERSQIERRSLALGAWKDGQVENAELILDTVLSEETSPRVAGACWISKAGFRAESGDFSGSRQALKMASSFVDSVDIETRGSFYFQRARVYRALGDTDSALTDYSGAAACWEESGNREKQGAAFLNLAELYLGVDELSTATENLNQSLALLKETGSFYLPQAYDTHAKILIKQNRPALALEAITQALSLVGDNEIWRKEFEQTKRTVEFRLLDLLGVKTLSDCDRLKVVVTEKALRETGGSLSAAGRVLDATHHAVSYIVDQNKELEPFRVKRRVYRRSIIKH